MKKITLLLSMLMVFALTSWGQLFITELADPNNEAGARFVEIYNAGTASVDLGTGWDLQRWTNDNTTPQTAVELTGTIAAGGFYIACANQTTFTATYGFAADQHMGTGGPADSNGDDQIALRDPTDAIVDMFGVVGEDGSGTNHEFENGRAERKATVTTGNTTYTFSEWNIWNDTGGAGTTNDPQDAPDDFDPAEWIGAASGPTISVSPSSLSGFSYLVDNGPSGEQSFTVEGAELTADITITPPTNYEISLTSDNGGTFSATDPISLTIDGNGDVATTTIYVRLKAGLTAGDYNSENITATSTGATDKTVSCSGSVTSAGGGGTEDFSNFPETGSSYANGTFIGQDGSTWTYNACRGDQDITDETPCLRNTSISDIYSGTISGGIGTVSFDYMQAFSTNVNLDILVNDQVVGTVTSSGEAGTIKNSGSITVEVSGGFVLKFKQNTSTGGQVSVDNVVWTAYSGGSSVDAPTAFSATTNGSDQIDLTWTENGDGNDVLIAWSSDGTFGTPVDGTAYASGASIPDGGTSLGTDADEAFSHTSLTSNTLYYYKIWSVDGSTNYSSGVEDNATTDAVEPSNHPTAFAATANSSSEITVSWTDAVPAADGYLIKGSDVSYDDIDAPVDGTTEANGTLVQNVAAGDQTFQFSGLTASTNYYFKIYPYNGTGTGINYKTDGTVPQATATTDPYTGPNAWINELHYDNAGTDVGEFVEIVIENAGTYTLSDFQVDLYNGGDDKTYDSETANNFTVGVTEGNYTVFYWSTVLQNGAPDGLALSYQGVLISGQFLSYEGTITAVDGPANGVTSTDIGVSETSSTPVGYSLQLKGGGDAYAMFYWVDPATETPGAVNNGQYFGSNYTTWTGATDDDWTDPLNWNNGAADATLNVIVPSGLTNYPTLSAAGSCINLFMESNASLVGVNYLTVSGTSTIERTIDGYTSDTDGYHFLSAPVSSFAIAGSDFEPVSGTDDFFSWDEETNFWLNYYGTMTDTEFEVGKGYLVAYDPTNPGTFTGSLNTASVEKTLSYTPLMGEGWNLLGNPFTSAINWNLLTKSAGVYGSVYVLDGNSNTYKEWNGSAGTLLNGDIPINNGFFVKTDAISETVTIDPEDQVHGSSGFLKKGNSENPESTLIVSISNELFVNNTYIQFRDDASMEFDAAIDAYKLYWTSDSPQLFTNLSETDYAINCLPFSTEGTQLTMGFKNRVASEYTISATGIDSFLDGDFEVFLEDTETNDLTNLGEENYSFIADGVDYDERFILHFSGITTVDEDMLNENVQIYSNGNSVYFRFETMPTNDSQVAVFNTLGQQVYGGEVEQSTMSSIRLNEKPGIYIVRLQSEKGTTTQKVMIK